MSVFKPDWPHTKLPGKALRYMQALIALPRYLAIYPFFLSCWAKIIIFITSHFIYGKISYLVDGLFAFSWL